MITFKEVLKARQDRLTAEKKSYFVQALHELRERGPSGDFDHRFPLTEIARQASRHDPGFTQAHNTSKQENYLGRGGVARRIMGELVETGQVDTVPMADMLLSDARDHGYGRRPNEDGNLYGLAEQPE